MENRRALTAKPVQLGVVQCIKSVGSAPSARLRSRTWSIVPRLGKPDQHAPPSPTGDPIAASQASLLIGVHLTYADCALSSQRPQAPPRI